MAFVTNMRYAPKLASGNLALGVLRTGSLSVLEFANPRNHGWSVKFRHLGRTKEQGQKSSKGLKVMYFFTVVAFCDWRIRISRSGVSLACLKARLDTYIMNRSTSALLHTQ